MNQVCFDTLDLMQAMQLGHAVAALQAAGVLNAMRRPRAAAELAIEFALDPTILTAVLDHVARATDLVRRQGRSFVTTNAWNDEARYLVGLYGLAFGRITAETSAILRHPEKASRRLNRREHAAAFTSVSARAPAMVIDLLRQLRLSNVIDIGCGQAGLLIALAQSNQAAHGYGIESNPSMRAFARAAIHTGGLTKRVKIISDDGRRLHRWLTPTLASRTEAVVASHFVNELFGQGNSAAIAWLSTLHQRLPGRVLLIVDYYGRLGSRQVAEAPLTLVHDHAQVLSGQGIPPPTRRDWISLYRKSGCRLVHAFEDRTTSGFVHLVKL